MTEVDIAQFVFKTITDRKRQLCKTGTLGPARKTGAIG